MKACCIYELKFPNGKLYIGMTDDFRRRMIAHKTKAKIGHHNRPLHNAIRKYGFGAVDSRVLFYGAREYVKEMECKLILAFGTQAPNGYNATSGGDGAREFSHTADTKERIRAASRNLWMRPGFRELMTLNRIGKKRDYLRGVRNPAHSVRMLERWKDPVFRASMSEKHRCPRRA